MIRNPASCREKISPVEVVVSFMTLKEPLVKAYHRIDGSVPCHSRMVVDIPAYRQCNTVSFDLLVSVVDDDSLLSDTGVAL